VTSGNLTIEHEQHESGTEFISISGIIDEHADLTPLSQFESTTKVLDLSGVERINSVGVQAWIRAMNALGNDCVVWWEKVSPPMVMQLNMIANFNGCSRIRSFYAPYYCSGCDVEHCFLLEVETDFAERRPVAPEFDCPQCQGRLEFDDVEEDYLGALMEALKEAGQ
jgi:anti-anti-sigma regulatory factor